jgi:UPF0755 protein
MRRLAAAALVLILAIGGLAGWLYLQYDAPGPLPSATAIVVPRGGLQDIAADLAQQGVVARPLVFRALALATIRRGPLHAGELLFPETASIHQVLAILRTARPIQHRLTIPEGLTAAQVAGIVDAADALTGDAPVPAEGSILPDTYNYERGTTREQLLDRARLAMDRALEAAWDARQPGLPLASKAEALVLASIVEKETGKASERALIAAVFMNRLRQGMKLQSDPTVVYVASGGLGSLGHPITRSELAQVDPYNTYVIAGLPPGPICMPGLAAIRAATQPAMSDALYFVADGTGGHAFARTQDDHLRNVAHWREIERARAQTPVPVQP